MGADPGSLLASLRVLHRRLLEEYVDVVNGASKTSWMLGFGDRGSSTEVLQRPSWMTRVFAENHVRNKLLEIAAAYVQRAAVCRGDAASTSLRDWLQDAARTCREVADSFSSWQQVRTLWTTVGPATIGLGVVKLVDLFTPVGGVWLGIIMALQLAMTMLSFVAPAYMKKRDLLFPAWREQEKRHPPALPSPDGRNVYRTEDELFAALGLQKRREFPLDVFVRIVAGVVGGGGFLVAISALWQPLAHNSGYVHAGIGLALFMALVYWVDARVARRRWK